MFDEEAYYIYSFLYNLNLSPEVRAFVAGRRLRRSKCTGFSLCVSRDCPAGRDIVPMR